MNISKTELESLENNLINRGYRKYSGHYKSESYGYWKSFEITFDEHDEKVTQYQIAFLIYDFSKYSLFMADPINAENPYGISVQFVGTDDMKYSPRLEVIMDINVDNFEKLYKMFYEFIKNIEL